MFITQTLESIDEEILKQTRLYAFGYGLTMNSELNKISSLIGDNGAISLYKSLSDPCVTGRYPFMISGPISPLSLSGAPIFVELE